MWARLDWHCTIYQTQIHIYHSFKHNKTPWLKDRMVIYHILVFWYQESKWPIPPSYMFIICGSVPGRRVPMATLNMDGVLFDLKTIFILRKKHTKFFAWSVMRLCVWSRPIVLKCYQCLPRILRLSCALLAYRSNLSSNWRVILSSF